MRDAELVSLQAEAKSAEVGCKSGEMYQAEARRWMCKYSTMNTRIMQERSNEAWAKNLC